MKNKKVNRVAQFLPFAALKGYYDLILEKQKEKQPRKILSQEQCDELNLIIHSLREHDRIQITYYRNENYVEVVDTFRSIEYHKKMIICRHVTIPLLDIVAIEKI